MVALICSSVLKKSSESASSQQASLFATGFGTPTVELHRTFLTCTARHQCAGRGPRPQSLLHFEIPETRATAFWDINKVIADHFYRTTRIRSKTSLKAYTTTCTGPLAACRSAQRIRFQTRKGRVDDQRGDDDAKECDEIYFIFIDDELYEPYEGSDAISVAFSCIE